ncbi:MAG: putative Ig domain-containing protein, partial [Candidatus Diapherotrites archaeon]|nr:putative Ig domain-containing protein [Candidatus Diapherotrites archaeon]
MLPATVGQEYNYSFCEPTLDNTSDLCDGITQTTNPTGGEPPYHFQLDSGSGFPPMGISLNLNGMLTGTPTAEGESDFTVCAVDLSGNQDCKAFWLTVEKAEVSETWEGTLTTSGRQLCREMESDNLEPGALSGSGSFIFSVPYNMAKALNNELEEGATETNRLRQGTLDFTETVASQTLGKNCKLQGASVSGAQFVVYVGLGSEVADE